MKTLIALVALALAAATADAQQCQTTCPAPQAPALTIPGGANFYQQQAPIVQVQQVAVPSFLFVVPSAPTVQLVQQPQYQVIPQAVVTHAQPVVVQRQVVQQRVVQPVVVQRQVVQQRVVQPVQRQRSFSFQRTVVR